MNPLMLCWAAGHNEPRSTRARDWWFWFWCARHGRGLRRKHGGGQRREPTPAATPGMWFKSRHGCAMS